MAYQSQFYTAGTVTVTDGSAIVNGSDTGWETALIEGGVFYVLGNAYPILSVEDETTLTLAMPFSGEGATGLAYAIDRQRSAAVSNIAMNDRLAEIIASIHGAQPESDLLSAFAALQGEDGKLPIFTSENTLGLGDYIADAKGSLAKLAALQLAANMVLRTNAEGAMEQSQLTSSGVALLKAPPVVDGQFLYAIGPNDFSVATITTWSRSFLASPDAAEQRRIMGYNRPAFKAHLAANQLVYNGTTSLSFTAAPLNVGNGWSGGRFTITQPGTYFFMLNITIGDGFAGQIIPQIFVSNGTNPSSVYSEVVTPIGPQSVQRFYAGGNVGAAIWLNTGSYVEFKLVLDAVQGNPYMGAFRCSATGFLM
ncbi:hypothetical protein F9L06_03885 [Brucella anthropi]|uniref:Uncharacterized protein n=1 Tax=Brucella anthropi TaxID=529 RepID=A0A6I0DW84_BRUAN|nr:hypothetical protein [Brucella anthropi]KAB2803308.1 hypothetical protein F9L06_03885 [Brucella anthropi]